MRYERNGPTDLNLITLITQSFYVLWKLGRNRVHINHYEFLTDVSLDAKANIFLNFVIQQCKVHSNQTCIIPNNKTKSTISPSEHYIIEKCPCSESSTQNKQHTVLCLTSHMAEKIYLLKELMKCIEKNIFWKHYLVSVWVLCQEIITC